MTSEGGPGLRRGAVIAFKIEGIRRFARQAAHDVNGVLATIYTTAELAILDQAQGKLRPEDLVEMRDQAKRAAALVREFTAFAYQPRREPRALELNDVVTAEVERLRQVPGPAVEISTILADDLWRITADPTHVARVVECLVENACAALPDGGRAIIGTSNVAWPGQDLDDIPAPAPGRYVRLAASVGAAVDATVRERFFEPRFPSRDPEGGVGQGLDQVYRLVRAEGGYAEGSGHGESGTTFAVYFPVRDADDGGQGQR